MKHNLQENNRKNTKCLKSIRIKPIWINGKCPINIQFDDEFFITGFELKNPKNSRICYECIFQLYQSINQLKTEQALFKEITCSYCQEIVDKKNSITFLAAYVNTWEIGKVLVQYSRMKKKFDEPADALKLRMKLERMLEKEKVDYEKILAGLKTALKMYKRCSKLNRPLNVF